MSKIILIGGPPRSGKTTLAQKLSAKSNIAWISTDAFDDIAKGYVSPADRDTLFPKTALRLKSGGGNDEMYATFSVKEIVAAYMSQAETVHLAVENFIRWAYDEGWDYIIEGYHITPKLIARLQARNMVTSSAILIDSGGNEVVDRSAKSTVDKDWLRDGTKQQETFQKIVEMIVLFSKELKQEAEKNNVKIIDMNANFQAKFEEALRHFSH